MGATETLWDSYIRRSREERTRKQTGQSVVSRDELEPELTPFGFLRWYMHPDLEHVVDRALYFFELEIPGASRSGKLRHQGGLVHLVVEGHGHTIFRDERYDWEALDVIAIPPDKDGVTFQHFNDGSTPSRLVVAFPNYDSPLGPELGVDMDVVEPAPEYTESLRQS